MWWLLLVLSLAAAAPSQWAAWELRRTSALDDLYVELSVGGEPPQIARMLLDFTLSVSTIWNPKLSHAASPTSAAASESSRRDWTRMGDYTYFIEYAPEPSEGYDRLYSSGLYYDADGRLALGRSSEIWQLWTGFALSYGTLILYRGEPPTPRKGSTALECERTESAPLCSVPFAGGSERVELLSNGTTTWLSSEAYDALFRKYNVYSSREHPRVDLAGGALSLDSRQYLLEKNLKQRRMLVARDPSLRPGTSVLGTSVVRAYDIEVDVFRGKAFVRRSAQDLHLDGWQLALELLLTLSFSVWFLVPLALMTTLESGKIVRVVLQLVTLGFVLLAYFLSGEPFSNERFDGTALSLALWLGLNIFMWYFVLATASVVFVGNVVLHEDERAATPRTYVQLGKAIIEDAILLGMWALLHESSALILSVYAAFLLSLFMAVHALLSMFLMIYYAAGNPLPRQLAWHYWVLLAFQIAYAGWNVGFLVWSELQALLLVDSPEFLYVVPYVAVPLELWLAKIAASMAHHVAHNRKDRTEMVFL